jgi:hypothetical protein
MNNPLVLTDPKGLQVASPVEDIIHRVDTWITKAGEFINRTFSYGGDTITIRERVPVFESISNSDPLQNANYERFQSRMNALNGEDDGGLSRRLIANQGPLVDTVLQRTQDSYKAAQRIGEANLIFQTAYTGLATNFLLGSSPSVTTNRGIPIRGTVTEILNPSELKFTDQIRGASLRANAASIQRNGVQKAVDYTVIDGEKYLLDGNNRTVLAKWFGQTLPGQRQSLPFGAWKNEAEVLQANDQYGNPFASPTVRNFFKYTYRP